MANYFIIGGDGNEYGPVTDTDVRQWIGEGRLNGKSQAKAESDAEFRPLETFPEFAAALSPQPPTIAPLKSSASSASSDFLERDYDLDIGGCISRGYQLLKDNFSVLFFTALTLAAIEGLMVLLSMIPFLGTIFSIANMVISGPLMGGVFLLFLRVLRGEPAEVGDMFSGFRQNFGQLFLGKFIPGLLVGLCVVPFVVVAVLLIVGTAGAHHQEPDPKMLVILIPLILVAMIPAIFLQVCWTFTLALIADKGMDFGAAMKASWKMVRKHWWHVFGLTLLVGLVNFAGVLACFVGVLFTVPIGLGAMMYAYETIFGAEKN